MAVGGGVSLKCKVFLGQYGMETVGQWCWVGSRVVSGVGGGSVPSVISQLVPARRAPRRPAQPSLPLFSKRKNLSGGGGWNGMGW